MSDNRQIEQFLRMASLLWLAITGAAVLYGVFLYGVFGLRGLVRVIQVGPLSIVQQTFVCVGVAWLTVGSCVMLLRKPAFRRDHGLALIGAAVLTFLYVNIVRERTQYGDVEDYVRAVFDLHNGTAFHGRYVYPPLLATLCQPLTGLGESGLKAAFWLANLVSLVAFYWILRATLTAYGFRRDMSTALVFLFMAVNVPVLRTLGYVQINLHVINLILLSALAFPRYRAASAFALALAVHLKASPLLVVPAFLLTRDMKWSVCFIVSACLLAVPTVGCYGWEPFASFAANARSIYEANGICFRENSIDSLVRGTGFVVGADYANAIPFLKLAALAGLASLTLRAVRQRYYVAGSDGRAAVLNGLPVLLVLMVLASPLVWEHHFVFLAVPFLLLLRKLSTPGLWTAYGLAYLLAFLMPTFDCYPWSFGRLLSIAILSVLTYRVCRRADAAWFAGAQEKLGDWEGSPSA